MSPLSTVSTGGIAASKRPCSVVLPAGRWWVLTTLVYTGVAPAGSQPFGAAAGAAGGV